MLKLFKIAGSNLTPNKFQLKEMVLAFLNESDIILSDDMVELIVDKVRKRRSLSKYAFN
jgi:hypothetical protein